MDLILFLPSTLNIGAINIQEMRIVSEECYKAIDECDVILAVSPYGQSVAAEIGYAVAHKRMKQKIHHRF